MEKNWSLDNNKSGVDLALSLGTNFMSPRVWFFFLVAVVFCVIFFCFYHFLLFFYFFFIFLSLSVCETEKNSFYLDEVHEPGRKYLQLKQDFSVPKNLEFGGFSLKNSRVVYVSDECVCMCAEYVLGVIWSTVEYKFVNTSFVTN